MLLEVGCLGLSLRLGNDQDSLGNTLVFLLAFTDSAHVETMNGIQASFFILLEAFVVVTGFSHSAYFTTRENKRLIGHRIKQVDSVSLKSCSQFCLRHPWCTSTNFQISTKMNGKETCELNMHGVIDENNDHFHDQEGVTFSLMLKVNIVSPMK